MMNVKVFVNFRMVGWIIRYVLVVVGWLLVVCGFMLGGFLYVNGVVDLWLMI